MFRKAFSYPPVFIEFFSYRLPEHISSIIDLESIAIEKTDFIDNDLGEYICDLLYSAKYKDCDEIMYILLECQSRPDKRMRHRIEKYTILIREMYFQKYPDAIDPPLVFTMLYSNAKNNRRMSLSVFSDKFPHKKLADELAISPVHFVQSSDFSDEELKKRQFSGIIEFAMKSIGNDDILKRLQEFKGPIQNLLYDQKNLNGRGYILEILCYTTKKIRGTEVLTYKELLHRILLEERKEEDIMRSVADIIYSEGAQSWAQYGYDTGMDIGIEKGIEQGIEQGLGLGAQKKEEFIVRNMIQDHLPLSTISKYTGLSEEEIRKINIKVDA